MRIARRILGICWLGIVTGSVVAMGASPAPSVTPELCERILSSRPPLYSERQALECMDAYFWHPDHDSPPGSFNKVVRFGYLAIARNPRNAQTYLLTAWLTYSQWRNFVDPSGGGEPLDPSHGDKHRETLEILRMGLKHFANSAEYLRDAGFQLHIQAKFAPEYLGSAKAFYERGVVVATTVPLKTRLLLNLGHMHREHELLTQARAYYERVLAIDPSNSVARRALENLEG